MMKNKYGKITKIGKFTRDMSAPKYHDGTYHVIIDGWVTIPGEDTEACPAIMRIYDNRVYIGKIEVVPWSIGWCKARGVKYE